MPVLRIRVTFAEVYVIDDADTWGSGEWFMRGTIDGRDVGDPTHEFEGIERQSFSLEPADRWTAEVDVSHKGPGDTVRITFQGTEHDPVGSNDFLGNMEMFLRYPFRNESDGWHAGSRVGGKQYFSVHIIVRIIDERATTSLTGFDDIRVSRGHGSATTFTATTGGASLTPRVEICPVIPVPTIDRLPPRPAFAPSMAAGNTPPAAVRVPPAAGLAYNALPNPAVIPILAPRAPDAANKAARIAVTYYEPGNLDISYFFWRVASGPVTLQEPTQGVTEVKAFGTGTASDQMATIELRWRNASGPLLATYRAWVGPVKQIYYRANIVSGDSRRSRVTNVTPADVAMHIDCCKMYFWQAGIELIPDDPATGLWDDAQTVAGQTGIFTIQLTGHNNWTRQVNIDVRPLPVTRLNFRPGVLSMIYVHSTNHRCAVATDRPGLLNMRTQTWASARGADETLAQLTGSPSTSWVRPSGIPGDGTAGTVRMLLMSASQRGTNRSDRAYANTRTPHLTQNDWDRLFAFIVPSQWSHLPGSNSLFSYNVAHEAGHVLGLRHRGNGGNPNPPLSNDEVNTPAAGALPEHGHPWLENIMTYHVTQSQDFDLMQAMVIRSHPLANIRP